MEHKNENKLTREEQEMKPRYCVLFTQTLKQWDVTETIKRALPEDRGVVFYPCTELWMGSLGQTVVEPLFPGYVFIRSDMGRRELHEFIRSHQSEIFSFVKELWMTGGTQTSGGDVLDSGEDMLTDLTDDESELLDFILGFQYEDSMEAQTDDEVSKDVAVQPADTGKNGKKIWYRKIPEYGVLSMSFGYRENDGRYVVVEGPLKGHEDRIVDVNPKDRRAYLNLKVGGKWARVGLEIRSKKYWYPKDNGSSVVLSDGFEINCEDIAAAMMRHNS